MQIFDYTFNTAQKILALGAESNGNFSFFSKNRLYFSEDFGDLLIEENFQKYTQSLLGFIKKNKFQPDIILTDLHPLYKTTILGENLAKKYKVKHISVQHHLAHIFSAIGDQVLQTKNYKLPTEFYGIALDGTGYGTDGKIWGGECFAISNFQFPISNDQISNEFKIQTSKFKISRIGHLENQTMIGGDLAIREPARMLIAILFKIARDKKQDTKKSQISNLKSQKNFVYNFIKKYYSTQEFEVLYNQLQQNFNCIETSSCGRVLDAVSLLLGFCGNERKYKHEPTFKLEENSTRPYLDIKPRIEIFNSKSISNFQFPISNEFPMTECPNEYYILSTTFLFEYLIKNIHKDKSRLAATAQLYIAEGLQKIIDLQTKNHKLPTLLAGGIANNKIISEYLISQGTSANKKVPRGDAGLSVGQIIYCLLTNSRN